MLVNQAAIKPSAIFADVLLDSVRPNIVQSIRAFRVTDLQRAAQGLGHRFLHADLANAQNKQDALDLIGQQFKLATQIGKSFDSLYDNLTGPIHKSGPQTGFVIVLEHLPANAKFDKEAREQLLDIFRDVADYWGDRKVPFRCFYSFSVARLCQVGNGVDIAEENPGNICEKMPVDKLLDISPEALRMSSPFNAHYWTAD